MNDSRHRVQRDELARRGTDVEQRQRRRVALELRRDAHDDLILIVRRVDLRDLPRAVGVVERRLHLIRGQAERRNPVTVHLDPNLRIVEPQIAVDVLDPGKLPDLVFEERRRTIELGRVGILQRELIGAARTLLAAQVDRRLVDHEHAHAGNLRQLRPELRDDLIDRARALGSRLQIDAHPALIERPPPPPPPPPPTLLLNPMMSGSWATMSATSS